MRLIILGYILGISEGTLVGDPSEGLYGRLYRSLDGWELDGETL